VGPLVSFTVVARIAALVAVLRVGYVSGIVVIGVIVVIVAIVVVVWVGPAQELTASAATNGLSREHLYFGQTLAESLNLWLIPDDNRRGVDSRKRKWPDGNFGHNYRRNHPYDAIWCLVWPVCLNCAAEQVQGRPARRRSLRFKTI